MTKTILITGATDGIGHATALRLATAGHRLLIHGRNPDKLVATAQALRKSGSPVATYCADLSDLAAVAAMARNIRANETGIDVLINNAGVFKSAAPLLADGQDIRFVVNTLAPALLTRALLPILSEGARVLHLSSAAQAPVDLQALAGAHHLQDMEAYAQSKLALTMWSQSFAADHPQGPVSVAINPGSLLATNMVRDPFGMAGNDIQIGADVLSRAALSDEFAQASGRYFDNDSGRFAAPQADAGNPDCVAAVVAAIEVKIAPYLTDPSD